MKYVILVGDGMGDDFLEECGGKSPLQKARIPAIRGIAADGETHLVQTVAPGMQPGSDVANLALLSYDPREDYTGRAPIEAAGAGISLGPEDVAYRCNLVTIADGKMDDYSAGHISSEEGRKLMETLADKLNRPGLTFHPGISYRHLLVWENGPLNIETVPPHDIAGAPVKEHLPSGEREAEIRRLMKDSEFILADHPVNKKRIAEGKKPATQIWLWGQGSAMSLPSFESRYNLRGGIVSAVDLVRGLGSLAGLKAVEVPGATGFLDTNYAGKRAATMDLLQDNDFVYLHIEAPDECGHMGRADLKIEAIEAFDREIVKPIRNELDRRGEPYRLFVCTDHRTPVSSRKHTAEPVPLALLRGPAEESGRQAPFDENVNGGKPEMLVFDFINKILREDTQED